MITSPLLHSILPSSLPLSSRSSMQRQSLGSPASKLEGLEKRKEEEDEEEKKADKLFRPSSRTEKSIHLLPVLTISCFLILYLVSHDPSPKDLVNIGAFEGLSLPKAYTADSMEIGALDRFFDVEKSEVLAMRSHRSLQEIGKVDRRFSPSNLHRKFGAF